MLEFLPELIHVLKGEGYSLTESEAAIFLPCLIEKVPFCSQIPFLIHDLIPMNNHLICICQSGHNIEKVREKMRELTKQIALVYSPSKIFPYAVEGLRSKNNRSRIESVDFVGFLIDHHGTEVIYCQ